MGLYILTETDPQYIKQFQETFGDHISMVSPRKFEILSSFPLPVEMVHGISSAESDLQPEDLAVEEYLSNYKGDNSFVKSVKEQYSQGRKLSEKQVSAIRKFLNLATSEVTPEKAPVEVLEFLKNYTGQNNFILSIKTQVETKTLSPKQIEAVKKFMAPAKEQRPLIANHSLKAGDYLVLNKFMARIIGQDAKIERSHHGVTILTVHHETEKAWLVDIELSAKKTAICCICGITLTNEESIVAGIGPICADKVGVSRGEAGVSQLNSLISVHKIQKIWIPKKSVKEKIES